MEATSSTVDGPFVRIVEQPARCALRSAGSIPGMNATADNKTYPTIQVINYKGPAVVVVSCVTKDAPYKAHPHNLVGKEGCKKGVCTVFISNSDMTCTFTSLGIQCVKRKDVEESLRLRESIKVDPFKAGFSHKTQAPNIDLNVVRLCFQVFIEGAEKDKFNVPLAPVVSHPIYDKKAMSELVISKLSHCSASATGGTEVVLLCDRVTKDDIQIRFHEERNGQVIWESFGEFQPNDVHKQVAISFRTPRYYDENITHPVTVMISLRRPSDNQSSDARPFQMLPRESDCEGLTRKRQKIDEGAFERFIQQMPSPPREHSPMNITPALSPPSHFTIRVPRLMPKIKHEIDTQQASSPPSSTSSTLAASSSSPSHLAPPSTQQLQQQQQQQQQQLSNDCFVWNLGLDQQQEQQQSQPQQQQQQQQQHQNQVTFLAPAPVASTLPLVKQETNLLLTAQSQLSGKRSSPFEGDIPPGPSYTNITKVPDAHTGIVDGSLSEKLDSLDLDIDPNDLINDINFNNMMVNLDSGNNITFNSSGNITESNNTQAASLNTPQIIDDTKNPLLAFVMSNDSSKR